MPNNRNTDDHLNRLGDLGFRHVWHEAGKLAGSAKRTISVTQTVRIKKVLWIPDFCEWHKKWLISGLNFENSFSKCSLLCGMQVKKTCSATNTLLHWSYYYLVWSVLLITSSTYLKYKSVWSENFVKSVAQQPRYISFIFLHEYLDFGNAHSTLHHYPWYCFCRLMKFTKNQQVGVCVHKLQV